MNLLEAGLLRATLDYPKNKLPQDTQAEDTQAAEVELFGPDEWTEAAEIEGKDASDDSTFKEGEEEEPRADDDTVIPDVE